MSEHKYLTAGAAEHHEYLDPDQLHVATVHALLASDIEDRWAAVSKILADLEALCAERERLFDLVRHQRMELLQEDLITHEEYAVLAVEHSAVARLESYDELRAELKAAQEENTQLHTLLDDALRTYAGNDEENVQLKATLARPRK